MRRGRSFSSPAIAEFRFGGINLRDGGSFIAGGAGRAGLRDFGRDAFMHAFGGVTGRQIIVHHGLEACDFADAACTRWQGEA
jgi:hypothetical protein